MKYQKILVLGATGKTGGRVAERLESLGQDIRRGSRNESPSFNWNDTSTWRNCLINVDAVYIAYQPDLAVPGAKEDIKKFTSMANEAGVAKLVLLSGRGEREAEICEEIVKNSDINWTIVRASWFNQNFSEGFFVDSIIAGHVVLPKTKAHAPFVDVNDIADVVVKALLEKKHNGKTYELTGPSLVTFEKAVEEISKTIDREIQFSTVTMEDYKNMLKGLGLPPDHIWLIEYLFDEVLVKENEIVTHDIEKVLGRQPTTFDKYVATTAQTGIWNPQ